MTGHTLAKSHCTRRQDLLPGLEWVSLQTSQIKKQLPLSWPKHIARESLRAPSSVLWEAGVERPGWGPQPLSGFLKIPPQAFSWGYLLVFRLQ